MPKWLPAISILGVGIALVILFKGFGGNNPDFFNQVSKSKPLKVFGTVPAFSLVAQSGEIFDSRTLEGKPWIADYIFTRCQGMCPILSTRMAQIQAQLLKNPFFVDPAGTARVNLVSFSADPNWDTPQRLGEYANRFNADPINWYFLTGKRHDLYTLAKDGFRISVASSDDKHAKHGEKVEGSDQRITHSDRFILIDSQSQIRAYYHGMDEETVEKALNDLRRLLMHERRNNRVSSNATQRQITIDTRS